MIDEGSDNYKTTPEGLNRVITKCSFETKKAGKNGLVLQVHHTLPGVGGTTHSYRFTSASFNLTGERLAVSEYLGNAFVIDLLSNKFWLLPKLPNCNFLVFSQFSPRKHDILVGSVSGPLLFINVDTGEVTGELSGHKQAPQSVSFAQEEPYCLTVCSSSAVIWDLRSNSLLHQLTLRSSIGIKQVKFMPVSNNILGIFEDNSVHVWKLESLECTKQIYPDEWGGPNVKTLAFSRNGRGMVLGGQAASLSVFLLDDWTLQKLIALPDNYKGVKQLEFVPQLFDGGANKVLAVLTSNCSVLFVDTETSVLLKTVEQLDGCVSRLSVSSNGKYVSLVMQTGEVNIYSSSRLLHGQTESLVSHVQQKQQLQQSHSTGLHRKHTTLQKVSSSINLNRLRPILKEFGEYPDEYRSLIWKTILNLPENQAAFVALINKGIHPAYLSLDKVFTLSDKSLSSSVKRLLSCLAYWSPIFLQVKYLPIFVLPFVRLIRHDQFSCFETIATIIVNWCQGWFEFVPYPALNVLDCVKQLLIAHDSQLISHYSLCHVTPGLYIWSLLETAFYEVLGWKEWLQLWDHILSNHPSFLLFVVVAFNIVCRSTLLYLQDLDDFEHFFYTECVISMKQLISKAYQLWANTAPEIHPKNTLRSFQPLVKGNMYQMFTDYPKNLLDNQLDKLTSLYEEKAMLESHKNVINKQKLEVDATKKHLEQTQQRKAKLRELQEAYRHALSKEEGRLENQRKNVSAARRELREKEVSVRSQGLDRTLQDKAEKYAELERLVEQIETKKVSSDFQSSGGWSVSEQSTNPSSLRLQHASVVHHLAKLKKLSRQCSAAHILELKLCISKFEDLLVRIESALEREQTSKNIRPCQADQIIGLEEETRVVEDEAQRLLKKLTTNREGQRGNHCSNLETPCCKVGHNQCYCCGDSRRLWK